VDGNVLEAALEEFAVELAQFFFVGDREYHGVGFGG